MKKLFQVALVFTLMFTLTLSFASCGSSAKQTDTAINTPSSTIANTNNLTGELITGEITVFHAGSLSVPFKAIADAFQKEYPGVTVKLSAGGSKGLAQKIITLSEQGQPVPDIYASADYSLIDNLIIPQKLANFNVLFAKNSIVIAYTDKSKYADEINADNWYEILSRPDIRMGRSDPELDPCGYRSVLVMELAEKYYKKPGLYKTLKDHAGTVIRPKEVDLVADLETGNIDYFWIYESVARQHHFKYITLPEQINLSSIQYADFYKTASITLTKPDGSKYTVYGKPIVYGITLINRAPHKELAEKFLHFVLTKGLDILEQNGQPAINPPQYTGNKSGLPENLRDIVIPASK